MKQNYIKPKMTVVSINCGTIATFLVTSEGIDDFLPSLVRVRRPDEMEEEEWEE